MADFKEFFAGTASRIAQGLGLKPSERAILAKWRAKFESDRTANADRWEQIKGEIRKLELRLRKLKAEHDAAHGKVQEMVARQIEGTFREHDRKTAQIVIVERNLESLTNALDRVAELEHARSGGVSEEALDDLASRLQEGFAEVKQTDRALEDLGRVTYEAQDRDPMDIDRRLASMDGKEPAASGLSPTIANRLQRLEKEMEG